jgi:hypothetical protein
MDGKVLIDTTNRIDPADPGSVLNGTSAAEQIQGRGRRKLGLATAREVAGKLLGNRTIGQPVTAPWWRERRADLR